MRLPSASTGAGRHGGIQRYKSGNISTLMPPGRWRAGKAEQRVHLARSFKSSSHRWRLQEEEIQALLEGIQSADEPGTAGAVEEKVWKFPGGGFDSYSSSGTFIYMGGYHSEQFRSAWTDALPARRRCDIHFTAEELPRALPEASAADLMSRAAWGVGS